MQLKRIKTCEIARRRKLTVIVSENSLPAIIIRAYYDAEVQLSSVTKDHIETHVIPIIFCALATESSKKEKVAKLVISI